MDNPNGGMRILGWAADQQGTGYYRLAFPLRAIANLPSLIPIQTHCTMQTAEVDQRGVPYARDATHIVAQRPNAIGMHSLWLHLLSFPRPERPALMIDIDDNFFVPHPLFKDLFKKQAAMVVNMRESDLVTVTTERLAQEARARIDTPVAVLPNCVPPEAFQDGFTDDNTISYSCSRSHEIDIDVARLAFKRLRTPSKLVTIGHKFEYEHPHHVHLDWLYSLFEYYDAIRGTVGIAPLRYHEFNYGKSNIKVLEYMAHGMPWVASDYGPYEELRELHGKAGFLVKKVSDWVDALEWIFSHKDEAQAMGEFGRQWVRENRFINTKAQLWVDAYNSV